MREIEFRGICKYSSNWIYGLKDNSFWNNIDLNTLGQYTGLKDKNGTKIYEGDVLMDGIGIDGIVVWVDAIAQFSVDVNNQLFMLNKGNPTKSLQLGYTTVIGNIHENKELIK